MPQSEQSDFHLTSFVCGMCSACLHQRPIIERLGTGLDLPVSIVNVMEDPDTAISHDVLMHPAFVLADGSRERLRIIGTRSARHLTNRIVPHLKMGEEAATAALHAVLGTEGELLGRRAKRAIRNASDRVAALEQIPLFADFTKRQLRTLNKMVDEVRYQAGTILFEQEDDGRFMLMLLEGTAVVKRNKRFVTRLGPGDVVGEMSIVDGEPRSATVSTDTEVTALVLERSDFEHLVENVPGLAPAVMATLSRRLRDTDRKLYG